MALKQIVDCLPEDYINELLNLQEVIKAKEQIDAKPEGSVYFSINVTPAIIAALKTHFGLDFSTISQIPMRWMKGDTRPHVDNGIHQFEKTHLVYLTDSPGNLIVDGTSYPISKGCAYSFAEGLRHETVNTGSEPRLLLGPMSEEGFAVGFAITILANGGTTIYFRQTTDVQYSTDNQANWINLGNYYPISFNNLSPSDGLVKVEFITDITFVNTNVRVNKYFICGSSDIQFGSTSLNSDGSRPVITIDGVTNYPGLIQNGTSGGSGYSNIYVYNLKVTTASGSTLAQDGGWIGQAYFGKGASDNYIVNCSSTGDISIGGGGILGQYAGLNSGSLNIIGCSSEGPIGTNGGGIIGSFASSTGNIICKSCWSIGNIDQNAGGICGSNAGISTGNITVQDCYSEGNQISTDSGGIFGIEAGFLGQTQAINCYSRGNIGISGGGIYGNTAGGPGPFGTTSAINCYTLGNTIYGSNKGPTSTDTNCYTANGTWDKTAADNALEGVPNPIIGNTWIYRDVNQPYELLNMGYTPYDIENIRLQGSTPSLNNSFLQIISAGNSTIPAIVSGKSYYILEISGGNPSSYSTITINSTTGAISTTRQTQPGQYILFIRNTGSYNISVLELQINEPEPIQQQEEVAELACLCSQKPCAQLSYVGLTETEKITNIADNRAIATSYTINNIPNNVRGRQFPSFADYLRYQQAQLKYY